MGDLFSTFDELETMVKADMNVHIIEVVQFRKRKARTIEAAKGHSSKTVRPT